MTMTQRITVAQEAQEYISSGPDSINASVPDRVLVYLARKYVEGLRRNSEREAARKVERAVSVAVRRTSEQIEIELFRSARRKAWEAVLSSKFSVGDGTDATWGEATREQHRARAIAQRKLSRAAQEDASLHELALADMARFGVSRLVEL